MNRPLLKTLQAAMKEAGLADLGPGPRPQAKPLAELSSLLDQTLVESPLTSPNDHLVRALVLLWHDHLDAAHTLAQQVENADGSYVHAIMHRREPDYWNSKYWFRQVGAHPCFGALAKRTEILLQRKDENDLLARLVANGRWDPLAFVDACAGSAARPPSQPQAEGLRAVQEVEFGLLLERFCHA